MSHTDATAPECSTASAAEQEQVPLLSSSRSLSPISEQWFWEDAEFLPERPATPAPFVRSAPSQPQVQVQAQVPKQEPVQESPRRHRRHRRDRTSLYFDLELPEGLVREDGSVDKDVLATLNKHISAYPNANTNKPTILRGVGSILYGVSSALGGALRAVINAPRDLLTGFFGIPLDLDVGSRTFLWFVRFVGVTLVAIVYLNVASHSWTRR